MTVNDGNLTKSDKRESGNNRGHREHSGQLSFGGIGDLDMGQGFEVGM